MEGENIREQGQRIRMATAACDGRLRGVGTVLREALPRATGPREVQHKGRQTILKLQSPTAQRCPWDVLSGDTLAGTKQDLCPGVTGKPVEMTETLGTSQGEALPRAPGNVWEQE